MAQSMVTIYKMVGNKYVQRYGPASIKAMGLKEVFRRLSSEEPGPGLLFKTNHYDPTSTAIIDELMWRFPHFSEEQLGRRYKDEEVDILTVTLLAMDLPDYQKKMDYLESNVEELNLLHSLVRFAVLFWSDLLMTSNIDSILIITNEILAPSLLDEDIISASG